MVLELQEPYSYHRRSCTRRLHAKLGVEHESIVTTVRGVGYICNDTTATARDYPQTDAESRLDIDAALGLDRSIDLLDLFQQTL